MIGMMNNGTADIPSEFFGTKKEFRKKEFRIYSEKRMLREKISYGKDGRMLVDGKLAAANEMLEPDQLWEELMMRMMCRAVCDSCLKEPAPQKRRFSDYLPWRRRAKRGTAAANAIANAATAVSELQTQKDSISSTKSPNITPKNSINDQKSAQNLQSDRHKNSTESRNSKGSEHTKAKTRNSSAKEQNAVVSAITTRFGKKKNARNSKVTENDASSTGSSENSSHQCSSGLRKGGTAEKLKSVGTKSYEKTDNNNHNKTKPNNAYNVTASATKIYSNPRIDSSSASQPVQLRNGPNTAHKSANASIVSNSTTSKAKRPTSTATEEMINALATKISSKISRNTTNSTTTIVRQNGMVRNTSSSSLKSPNVVDQAVLRNSQQPRARRPLSISTLTSLATKSSPKPTYKNVSTAVAPGPGRPLHTTTTASNSISTRFFGNGGGRTTTQATNQSNMQRFSKVR